MHSRRIGFIAFFILVIIMITAGWRITSPKIDQASIENPLFLQNNIHARVGSSDTKASYANWTDPGADHIIIPVNTPVEFGGYRRDLQ
jgi:hypothetical protein